MNDLIETPVDGHRRAMPLTSWIRAMPLTSDRSSDLAGVAWAPQTGAPILQEWRGLVSAQYSLAKAHQAFGGL